MECMRKGNEWEWMEEVQNSVEVQKKSVRLSWLWTETLKGRTKQNRTEFYLVC